MRFATWLRYWFRNSISADDWTGETATFAMPGAARDGEGFVVLVQKGTPERPGVILAAAKTEGF